MILVGAVGLSVDPDRGVHRADETRTMVTMAAASGGPTLDWRCSAGPRKNTSTANGTATQRNPENRRDPPLIRSISCGGQWRQHAGTAHQRPRSSANCCGTSQMKRSPGSTLTSTSAARPS